LSKLTVSSVFSSRRAMARLPRSMSTGLVRELNSMPSSSSSLRPTRRANSWFTRRSRPVRSAMTMPQRGQAKDVDVVGDGDTTARPWLSGHSSAPGAAGPAPSPSYPVRRRLVVEPLLQGPDGWRESAPGFQHVTSRSFVALVERGVRGEGPHRRADGHLAAPRSAPARPLGRVHSNGDGYDNARCGA